MCNICKNDELGSGGRQPLGNNANNVATLDNKQVSYKPLRKQLYRSKRALTKAGLGTARVRRCRLHSLGRFTDQVKVEGEKHPFIHLQNLETCGSVWACPVCRHRILNHRSEQLQSLYDNFKASGGYVSLVTLTVPHYAAQSLQQILGDSSAKTGLSGAFRRLRQHRLFRQLKSTIAYEADTRVYECTFGRNGFHLHVHMAVYHREVLPDNFEERFLSLWTAVTTSAGFSLINGHGVDVRDMTKADYIAKWGAPSELAGASQKSAKTDSYNVHELETLASEIPKATVYDRPAIHGRPVLSVLREYYDTMHGKKLLTWAGDRDFRKRFAPDLEKTDEELAEIRLKDYLASTKLSEIDASTWKHIYWSGDIPALLQAYELDGIDAALAFIVERYPVDICRKIEPVSDESLFAHKLEQPYYSITKSKDSVITEKVQVSRQKNVNYHQKNGKNRKWQSPGPDAIQ